MSRLDSFLLDDEGAISLITEDTSETDDSSDETDGTQSQDSAATQDSETEQDSTSSTDTPGTDEPDPSTSTTPEVTQPPFPADAINIGIRAQRLTGKTVPETTLITDAFPPPPCIPPEEFCKLDAETQEFVTQSNVFVSGKIKSAD